MTQSGEDRFAQIDTRLESIETSINDLRVQLAENTASITTLQTTVAELTDIARLHQQALRISQHNVDQLTSRFDQFLEQAAADRTVMREILQYLRNQYPGNGKGGMT